MAEQTKITCQGCGEVFTEFLQDMADHNEKVVCPKCGQVHEQNRDRKAERHGKGHS